MERDKFRPFVKFTKKIPLNRKLKVKFPLRKPERVNIVKLH